jgi:Ca2+-binding EF-hand superfamily protein
MGCGSSSTASSSTSVVPSSPNNTNETKDSNVPVRRASGTDIQAKEALLAVFDSQLLQQFGTKSGQKKMILTRKDFLDKVFPTLCVGVMAPPPESKDFKEQATKLFDELDTNKNQKMSAKEFYEWYKHELNRVGEHESGTARIFFNEMKRAVRVQEDNLAKAWLDKRGGFTEEEVTNALSGLFKLYDANGDGVLDDVEFGNLMLEIMDARYVSFFLCNSWKWVLMGFQLFCVIVVCRTLAHICCFIVSVCWFFRLDALGQRSKGIAHDRLSRKAASAIIIMMDEDENGTLDMNEFQSTLAESLKWNDERVQAAAERLSDGDEKLTKHLVEFFQAMTWCVGKYIKKGGVKRALDLGKWFGAGPDPDVYWNQS